VEPAARIALRPDEGGADAEACRVVPGLGLPIAP